MNFIQSQKKKKKPFLLFTKPSRLYEIKNEKKTQGKLLL